MINVLRTNQTLIISIGIMVACFAWSGCSSPEPVWPDASGQTASGTQVAMPQEVVEVHPTDDSFDDLPPVEPGPGDWPWWLGPTRDNVAAADQNPPVRWSATENVVWRADVPGRGHGSPCIWGDRIFLPTAEETPSDGKAPAQYLLCYDRGTGRQLWQTEIHRDGFMHTHRKNTQASSTPACDGQRVFVPFMVQGGIWLTAVDLQGKIVWQVPLGRFKSYHGYAPSPVIYKSLVIVVADTPGGSFMVALHRASGEVVWRIPRTNYQSFGSANVGHVAGRDQLVVVGPHQVASYDPNSGNELWVCDGPTKEAATTPVFSDTLVYATAGYPKRILLAIRADGSGNVTQSHIVWRVARKAGYVPTPLLYDGLLYLLTDEGLLRCFDATTGDEHWQEQLRGGYSASPVAVAGRVYVVNEDGLTYVLAAGREFKILAENNLTNGGFATPVLCGGRIYLRTLDHLYCLGE